MERVTVSNELEIRTPELSKAMMVFRALNNKVRRQILLLLHQNKTMTVSSVYHKLKIEQSVASAHLAILRKERIVTTDREGKHVHYSVNYKRLNEIGAVVQQLLNMGSAQAG